VNTIAISPDSRFIISGSHDKSIKVFEIASKEQVHHLKNAHTGYINAVIVTPNGKSIVSVSSDKTIKIFDLGNFEKVFHFKNAHQGIELERRM